jgi:diadenosine tetraphosphate (Ap4A) HIT family hydrolase
MAGELVGELPVAAAAARARAAPRGCVFCEILSGAREAAIVAEGEHCVALMDVHPVRPGHVLVVPRAHHAEVRGYPEAAQEELFRLGRRIAEAQRAAGLADAITYLLLDGAASGQHFAHVHLHVVPRHRGDLARVVFRFATRMLLDAFGRPVTPKTLAPLADRIRAQLR